MRQIASLEELKALAGQEIAVSEWTHVSQEQVDRFADATGDLQWIHIDPERCRKESPFGSTIAHGFLTLSMLPMFMNTSIAMTNVRFAVNYGLNKVRFPSVLPVGSDIRGRVALLSVDDVEGGAQMTWQITVERKGVDKPVCVAELISRRY